MYVCLYVCMYVCTYVCIMYMYMYNNIILIVVQKNPYKFSLYICILIYFIVEISDVALRWL